MTTTNPTTATMAHQGRKGKSIMARDKNKGATMSDQEPEATEPEAQPTEPTEPGTTPEPTEGEPATPKPTTDELVAVLRSEVDSALANASGENLAEGASETLQAAYRAVPAAKRGQVQAEILREKISEPGANHQAIATILEVMTQAPTAKTRAPKAAKPEVPEHQLLAQAINALDVAKAELLASASSDEVRTEAQNLADSQFSTQIEDEAVREAVLAAASKAVKAVTVKARKSSGGGTGGPRTIKTETLANLIERGALTVGAELKHGENVATVTAEGKLQVGSTTADNPTAAAKAAGVTSSVNGWDYWQFDGKPVGNLRQS